MVIKLPRESESLSSNKKKNLSTISSPLKSGKQRIIAETSLVSQVEAKPARSRLSPTGVTSTARSGRERYHRYVTRKRTDFANFLPLFSLCYVSRQGKKLKEKI